MEHFLHINNIFTDLSEYTLSYEQPVSNYADWHQTESIHMSHMNHSFIIQTAPRLNAFIRANQTALVMLYVLYCIVNIIWFWYSQKKKKKELILMLLFWWS